MSTADEREVERIKAVILASLEDGDGPYMQDWNDGTWLIDGDVDMGKLARDVIAGFHLTTPDTERRAALDELTREATGGPATTRFVQTREAEDTTPATVMRYLPDGSNADAVKEWLIAERYAYDMECWGPSFDITGYTGAAKYTDMFTIPRGAWVLIDSRERGNTVRVLHDIPTPATECDVCGRTKDHKLGCQRRATPATVQSVETKSIAWEDMRDPWSDESVTPTNPDAVDGDPTNTV